MLNFPLKVMTSNGTSLFSVGQAGFIIKSVSGQLLAIDLYLSNCVERAEKNQGFKRLLPQILDPSDISFDAIVCTHPHFDHFDIDAVPEILSKGGKLFCSLECGRLIDQLQLDYFETNISYVKPGDIREIGDFRLIFVSCDHGEGAPDAVGVVVEVDGKRIFEAGDTCLRLDRIGEIPGPLDALIAPINGAYGNLNEEECVELAKALQAKVTIPCHYGMFASHHGDVGRFFDLMKKTDLDCLVMQQGEAYQII